MTSPEEPPEIFPYHFDEDGTPRRVLALRTLAMPADANASGDIFGGWVLSQMDIAAGIAASARSKGRVATIAIDAMKFHRPIYVGDVLCVYSTIIKTGRTSMTIELEAWALRQRFGAREKVTEGIFTFVAIDEDGNPRGLPAQTCSENSGSE